MKPYHDTPTCHCGGPMVLVENATWNHRADDGERIVCCACGDGRAGTDAEFEQARRADEAWKTETRAQ
jgi:hypothetical protein